MEILDLTESDDLRSVYDGSISDSILRNLSAYYNSHAKIGDSYIITRPSQYSYRLIFGKSSDGINYTDATIVDYTYTSTQYNQHPTVTVTNGSTISADVQGYSGYIYSSSARFLPSSYVDNSRGTPLAMNIMLLIISIFLVGKFIYDLVMNRR